ncbi:Mannan endo-1,6-alpha-mannosidase [Wickerhamomyces ciferrii]|uniref:Mannan endo-1,6-alpha-mannosidase n=1 Tax=Wickerhamomyces ciferrii (strain ATCC 14091 / BCRC 22168 / CBS 111 / JCM 3599 / NBRC 0793 / NRRL Y-1031 F-60-10) TaxID=1206466 RepID=K0KY78_WICCF|nr:Mannan endo-1,6-alpha-mannosidase [Wickerhamomyces ciferrii]CCH46053.1 Mannan endo-1,6-alpha-mannosidase [Wickerhamomyces ciferrii]
MKINPLPLLLCFTTLINALEIDIQDKKSICSASSQVYRGMMDYYDGDNYGGVVGMFQPPYYWWQAGHAWGGVIDYWYYCGKNESVEQVLYDSLMAQTGKNFDYIPQNQSTTEGNDDQGFWGIFVMSAAERNFTPPHEDSDVPDWLSMSQAVYNTMWERWDTEHCGGGLRWQIFEWNSGYDYKNTVSTACLFQMAARLARFTRNDSYVETAETVYQWLIDSEFIVEEETTRVYDGSEIGDGNCSNIVRLEWTYNFGLMVSGAAYIYNYTESDEWFARVSHLVNGASVFFDDGILYERACQGPDNCNNDQRSFKAVFSRSLAMASVLVPALYDDIRPLLESSAEAAAKSCSGGSDGVTCGLDWTTGEWDGKYGLGEQMSALEIFNSLVAPLSPAPFSQEDEGVAVGNPNAGIDSDSTDLAHQKLNITGRDKAGAAIITALIMLSIIIGAIWMVL